MSPTDSTVPEGATDFEVDQPSPPKQESLKKLAVSSSLWTLTRIVISRIVRFGSHLALAWLLIPEYFGIMLIVNIVQQGLEMLSDTGAGASLIQHKRGEEPAFYNTAWTIQIFRGVLLFLATCALAWPIAMYRDQPQLLALLPVAGFGAVISGFNSTSVVILHRNLKLGWLSVGLISEQLVHVGAMIALAIVWPSVWALVLGGLAGRIYWLAISHTLLSQGRCRFQWDRDAVNHLIRFGRWVFLSTALTYVIGVGDKWVMGSFMSDAELGLYGIAFMLAMIIPQSLRELTSMVLFPLYSRIAEANVESLRSKMLRIRLILLAGVLPPLCVIIVFGDVIVQFLYKPEFWQMGWIVELLAIGGIASCITLTSAPVLLAVGDSFRHMIFQASSALLLVISMAVGGWLGGETGVIAGVAAAPIVSYLPLIWSIHKYNVWMPKQDLLATLACAATITLGLLMH